MLHDLSYLAGLVDGEGHVAFSSSGVDKKRFVIEVKMTDESVIDWLHSNFKGTKYFKPSSNPKWKHQWRWRIQGQDAKDLYIQLKPLLKIKNHIEL